MVQKFCLGQLFCQGNALFKIRLDHFVEHIIGDKRAALGRKIVSAGSIMDVIADCTVVHLTDNFLVIEDDFKKTSDKFGLQSHFDHEVVKAAHPAAKLKNTIGRVRGTDDIVGLSIELFSGCGNFVQLFL